MILLILGGILIIFIYIIRLCPNKKINLNLKIFLIFPFLFILPKNNNFWKFEILIINKIYTAYYISIIIIIILFLILTLIIVSKNLKWINAPIKKFTYAN